MIQLVGVPSFAGALYPGTDETPGVLRKYGIKEALEQVDLQVSDWGDIALPSCLPRHDVPPVRNWPAPRMVWEAISDQAKEWFAPNKFNLLLGGDCSMIAGVADYLGRVYGDKLFILVVDAHVDVIKPDPNKCVGAAGMGLWFLSCENSFWNKPASLSPEQITVLACQDPPAETYGITCVKLDQLQDKVDQTMKAVLAQIPGDAKILVHFDVDSVGRLEMPAAYAPSERGLSMVECCELLTGFVSDPRCIGMEITEFSALKDIDGENTRSLISLLAKVLGAGLTSQARLAGAVSA